MSSFHHIPVLLKESLDLLNVRSGLTYIDATAGAGGHLRALLNRLDNSSTLVGLDRDLIALDRLKDALGNRVKLVHTNYSNIETVLSDLDIAIIDGGIIADLGVSSMQLDCPDRGFSFLKDGPLDMRMDQSANLTAYELVNSLSEKQLSDILFKYGEERQSRRIAKHIIECRPLNTTHQLAEVVSRCLKKPSHKPYPFRDLSHPATRTFQALRIAVNDELGSLERFLRAAIRLLAPGARLVVITFHSLEDRLVKQIFREAAAGCTCPPRQPVCTCHRRPELLIITRKPIVADDKEVLANPRSRSAKLRAGEKMG